MKKTYKTECFIIVPFRERGKEVQYYHSGKISQKEYSDCKSEQENRLEDLEKQKTGLEKEKRI